MHSDYPTIIVFVGFLILLIALYVSLVRWVLRINDIVFYLDKINEKLSRIEQQQPAAKK
jgi:hypothetical protein